MRGMMRLALLGVPGAQGAAGPVYLLRDDFTTDEAAPLTSPRTCEPGPGTWTITDTQNYMSISGGALTISGAVTANDPQALSNEIQRVAGRTFFWRGKAAAWLGVALSQVVFDIRPTGGGLYMYSGVPLVAMTANAYYDFAAVMRSSGGYFVFIKGQEWANWTLVFVYFASAAAETLLVSTGSSNAAAVDYVYVLDVTGPLAEDYAICTLNVAAPVSDTAYTHDADGIIDLTVTAPDPLDGSADTRCGFYYRADADLTPSWHCYVDGTGAFRVDTLDEAGARTNRTNIANAITAGQTRTLRAIFNSAYHRHFTLNNTTWTRHGNGLSVSHNDTATTVVPVAPAGWAISNLQSYPWQSENYLGLDINP